MAVPEPTSRLIVTADDFGRSSSVNRAVAIAHQQGILTCASLMVTGEAFDEAICIARNNPRLGVGLHLTLLNGRSCLSKSQIPDLVNSQGQFAVNPLAGGLRYFFIPRLRAQLANEIASQLNRFRSTGLDLDHVTGHLNIHVHPTIARSLIQSVPRERIVPLRLTRDLFWLNCRIASGRWAYRLSHAIVFTLLSAWLSRHLRNTSIPHTRAVFGLLQTGQVDEQYLLRLLPRIPPGNYELYSHPSLDQSQHELDALISPRVMEMVRRLGIRLIRYSDL